MSANQSQQRVPIQPTARGGFIVAVVLWVFLTATVAFLHHLFFGSSSTVVGGGNGQVKAAFWVWMPHSAIGYLLLFTIAIDVFIDMRDSKTEHIPAWWTVVGVVSAVIASVVFDAVNDIELGFFISLIACLPLKYFALRDYKW